MRLIDAEPIIEKLKKIIHFGKLIDANMGNLEAILADIEALPTADLSEYCDKLWKTAYKRGKAENIIRCDECQHWDLEWIPAVGEGHYCPMMDHVMVGDEWCCYGERRKSDG